MDDKKPISLDAFKSVVKLGPPLSAFPDSRIHLKALLEHRRQLNEMIRDIYRGTQ